MPGLPDGGHASTRGGDDPALRAVDLSGQTLPDTALVEAVEAEGFRKGGVVAPAFGDVQVTGVFDGRDDRGADGSQVDRPVAGAAGRGVLGKCHVPYVVMCLDSPVLAHEAGQVLRAGLAADQAADGVNGVVWALSGSHGS